MTVKSYFYFRTNFILEGARAHFATPPHRPLPSPTSPAILPPFSFPNIFQLYCNSKWFNHSTIKPFNNSISETSHQLSSNWFNHQTTQPFNLYTTYLILPFLISPTLSSSSWKISPPPLLTAPTRLILMLVGSARREEGKAENAEYGSPARNSSWSLTIE